MCSGRARLSKVRLARCRVLPLFRELLVRCLTLDTGSPCASHCLRRQGSISSGWLNSASGTRTVALVEFIRISLDVVTLLLQIWLIFWSSSELSFVLASIKIEPSDRRMHENSSLNLLWRSVHIFMPFGLVVPFSFSVN